MRRVKLKDLEAGAPPRTGQLEAGVRCCNLLAEWTLRSQVALLSLHSHICKMGFLPQRFCMGERQYLPKWVRFCEDMWGEDSCTSDLFKGVLSGETRLLCRKGDEAEQELKFPVNSQPVCDPMGSSRAKIIPQETGLKWAKMYDFHGPTPVCPWLRKSGWGCLGMPTLSPSWVSMWMRQLQMPRGTFWRSHNKLLAEAGVGTLGK